MLIILTFSNRQLLNSEIAEVELYDPTILRCKTQPG
jgi:hypothetical protein